MFNLLKRILKNRKGAALVEYGMLIGGVALMSAGAVSIFGHKTSDIIASVATILPGAHTDDNGPMMSGKLIETTQGTTPGGSSAVVLDIVNIASYTSGTGFAGTARLGNNLGLDLTDLVKEPR